MYRYSQGVLLEDPHYTLNIVPGSGPRHMIFLMMVVLPILSMRLLIYYGL